MEAYNSLKPHQGPTEGNEAQDPSPLSCVLELVFRVDCSMPTLDLLCDLHNEKSL